MELPRPCLAVLIGPSGSGKSRWAASAFAASEIVSSDALRAMVGEAADDLAASSDAFALLDAIVDVRLRRRLTTVIDTLGLEPDQRRGWVETAGRRGVPAVAVMLATPPATCRAWNRARPRPVPLDILNRQIRRGQAARTAVTSEGFAVVTSVDPSQSATAVAAPAAPVFEPPSAQQGLRFGLHISRFDWPGGGAQLAPRLRRIAADAAEAGFESLWVMDHARQIPQVGRAWEDLPESFTTLGFLAACGADVRLGALVAGITYRNVAHLGRIVATLDVLSGGRAVCGLGTGWFAEEHHAYGWRFPPLRERYELLADALELFPLLWGPGSPAFTGRRVCVPEAICYPRPIQQRIPIIVGGSGEKQTLRLVAEHADGCNLFGDAATVRRKLDVLAAHCAAAGRDPHQIEVTHLSTALAGSTPNQVAELAATLRPGRTPPSRYAAAVNAATAAQHATRFRALHAAGVDTAIVRLADLGREDSSIERFARVISALRS